MNEPTLGNERAPAAAGASSRGRGSARSVAANGEEAVTRKRKITISLSEKSIRALDELRRATDADTDSEVFRNALRLHLTLVRANEAGVKLFMKRDGSEEAVPVTLFAEPD
jgi:hypothetical protein